MTRRLEVAPLALLFALFFVSTACTTADPDASHNSARALCDSNACFVVYDQCARSGQGTDCDADLNACLSACPPAPAEPTCEGDCADAMTACITDTGDRLACDAAYQACLGECPPPPPNPCADACAQQLTDCLSNGGDRQACEDAATACYDAC